MAVPLIPIIAMIASRGIATAIKKYGTTAVKRAVTQAKNTAKKKPNATEPAKRLQQRQAVQAARKAETEAAKRAMATGSAIVTGASAGKEAGKAINASRKKKTASPAGASMTSAQKRAGGKLPKAKPKAETKTTSAADRVAREANNTPTPQEIARAKAKGEPKTIAQARKMGKDYFVGRDGKKKAAVTKEELAKSGLSLRAYLNKQKKGKK